MARHYSARDFFRQMPNGLLARYFQAQGLFGDLDFTAVKEGKPDELFSAWLALADGQRQGMDAELQEIFAMSCEKGFRAIIDEELRQWPASTAPFFSVRSPWRSWPRPREGFWREAGSLRLATQLQLFFRLGSNSLRRR